MNNSIDVSEIHKTRPLTLAECDELLDYRRMFGDLHPDNIRAEQDRFFASIKHLRIDFDE
jgi:hypothetical protein